jgi:hypothetical protein
MSALQHPDNAEQEQQDDDSQEVPVVELVNDVVQHSCPLDGVTAERENCGEHDDPADSHDEDSIFECLITDRSLVTGLERSGRLIGSLETSTDPVVLRNHTSRQFFYLRS